MNSSNVTIGSEFPSIHVQTTQGKMMLPDHYKGKWILFFSHPADFTPVCTTEFVSYALHQHQFEQMNCELIGLSIDSVFSHMKWIEWIRDNMGVTITFPIIADPLGEISKQLGILESTKTTSVRAVFLVDPKGRVRLQLHYPPEVGRNTEEILRALFALQTADEHKLSMPANWPDNELIGKKGLLSPPSSVEKVQKRLENTGDYECLDWWFCYQNIKE
ncbi:peroxiredoxin [Alkalihalobacterium bogoriense]|uniref:peroxiredoxin n=1 Tax=Alkalihalobacterium bogoriense TaxID=246272 RepID=UPI00047A0EC7|nr:peroxiredoxin [Alkalihalobacterium bogoriense]